MKKCMLLMIILLSFSSIIYSQDKGKNNEKYWYYRERMKNFMFQGNGAGSSIILGDRGPNLIRTGDQPWQLGYWIATLAMEWKLLHDNNKSTAQTEQDLYYAIDAISFKTPTT
jgi:hypothetical protein